MKLGYVITWKIEYPYAGTAIDVTQYGTAPLTFETWVEAINVSKQNVLNDAVAVLNARDASQLRATIKFMHTQAL